MTEDNLVNQLRADNERLDRENAGLADLVGREIASKVGASLIRKMEDMEAALEFYASPSNYTYVEREEAISVVEQDAGETARAVLAKCRGLDNAVPLSSDPQASFS